VLCIAWASQQLHPVSNERESTCDAPSLNVVVEGVAARQRKDDCCARARRYETDVYNTGLDIDGQRANVFPDAPVPAHFGRLSEKPAVACLKGLATAVSVHPHPEDVVRHAGDHEATIWPNELRRQACTASSTTRSRRPPRLTSDGGLAGDLRLPTRTFPGAHASLTCPRSRPVAALTTSSGMRHDSVLPTLCVREYAGMT
jgi:hypothetical protein